MPTTRIVLRVALAASAAAAAWLLWSVYRSPDQTDLATYWQLVIAVVALFATLVPLWREPRDGDRGSRAEHRIGRAKDELARTVRLQWERAAAEQGLLRPEPIALGWRPLGLTPAGGGPHRRTDLPPLPGYHEVDRRLSRDGGDVRDLHTVLGGLACGRLVLSGEPGSGKSAAAALLVLDLLHHRALEPDRAGGPVPVPVPLAGWDPRERSLREWVAHQLGRTSGRVFAGRRGRRTARDLFDAGGILLVLDGLDEMADAVRPDAVAVLNDHTSTRVVLTARSAELADTLREGYLHDAVVVGIDRVGADDAAAYLARTRPVDLAPEWGNLVERIREDPDGPLARVLDNPLAITLARDGLVTSADVTAFLDLANAPGVDQRTLEDHLLDQLVETAYRARAGRRAPRYDVDTARRTLRWVADRLGRDGRRTDLEWWRLPTWTSRLLPALAVGAVTAWAMFGFDVTGLVRPTPTVGVYAALAAAGAAVGAWCVAGADSAPPVRWSDALRRPALAGGYGLVVGVLSVGGLVTHLGAAAPAVVVAALLGGIALTARSLWRSRRRGTRIGPAGVFVLGLGLGAAAVVVFVTVAGTASLLAVYLVLTLVSIGLALRLGLAHPAAAAADPALAPLASWRRWRWTELVGWFTLAFPCGLLVRVSGSILTRFVWGADLLALGLAPVCGALLGIVFPESWLAWFACVQLAVRHRLPRNLLRFLDDARERGVLRAVGPVYQFRHRRLQERLAGGAVPSRRPVVDRATEDKALVWVAHEVRDSGRVAWWRVPTWAPRPPRVAVVALAGGVTLWLGFGLLDAPVWGTVGGPLVGICAVVGTAAGAARLEAALAAAPHAPEGRLAAVGHPVLVGTAVGLAFAVDSVIVVPPAVGQTVSTGLVAGVVLWLLLGAVISFGRGGVAHRRWRGITKDRPLFFGFLVATTAGYLVVHRTLDQLSGLAYRTALNGLMIAHLLLGAVVVVVGLRAGARAADGDEDPSGDPLARWRRRRGVQLVSWVAVALAGAFVVRSAIRVALLPMTDVSTTNKVVLIAVTCLVAIVCGLVLGLLFPPTWLTSLACLQLALRPSGPPRRLMRVLDDALAEGRVGTDGDVLTVRRAAEPARGADLAAS